LRELSIQLFGLNLQTNEPKTLLKLKYRASHSNFAECDGCRAGRLCESHSGIPAGRSLCTARAPAPTAPELTRHMHATHSFFM
jgi:hypothetical protein